MAGAGGLHHQGPPSAPVQRMGTCQPGLPEHLSWMQERQPCSGRGARLVRAPSLPIRQAVGLIPVRAQVRINQYMHKKQVEQQVSPPSPTQQ